MELTLVDELKIGLQDVAFQPYRASLDTTFLKNCEGQGHGTTTCPKIVAGGKQEHDPCKIFLFSNKSPFCVSFIF